MSLAMFSRGSPKPADESATPTQRRVIAPAMPVVPKVASADGAVAGGLRLFAGLRIGDVVFTKAEDLKAAGMQHFGVLNSLLGIDASLSNRVAVIRGDEGMTFALYFDEKSLQPEEIRAVVKLAEKKGFKLAAEGPQAHFAGYAVITSLAHGHIGTSTVAQARNDSSSLLSSFNQYVNWGVVNNADDIDWILLNDEESSQIAFKIEGRWHQPDQFRIPTPTMQAMLGSAWQHTGGGASATFEQSSVQQGNLEIALPRSEALPQGGRVRLRWSGLPNEKGTVVTTRIQRLGLTARINTLVNAGYLPWQIDAMRRAIRLKGGMVTFAGRVGSGKTTALAILLGEIPRSKKIQTAEDPVEIDIPGAFQRTIARDLSDENNASAFEQTNMGILRSALDIFYQSEIRDHKSGRLARQVLESGHGVYTTTHARSGMGIVNRFTSPEIGIPREVLGLPDGLKTNIFQAMISTTCPCCGKSPNDYAKHHSLTGKELSAHRAYFGLIESLYNIDSEKFRLRDEMGCDHCRRPELASLNGFAGRTPVCEIIEFDETMLELVYRGDDYGLMNTWRSMSNGNFEDPDLTGKTAMECAIYKASLGMIDPRQIEPEFTTFESIARNKKNQKVSLRVMGAK
jgi:type II secretory ATPase GspE/PulE/Tfp pilus assembly ATPase PilB-like protein